MREIIDGAKLLVLIDLKTENEVEMLLAKQTLILDLLHSNQNEDAKEVLFKHFSLLKEALKKASFFFQLNPSNPYIWKAMTLFKIELLTFIH